MASLVLGAVGAGVGSLFGAASIGWSIGSFIGGQLFGEQGQDIKGPRLSDKSVSTSAYGNMRPVIYGSFRVGGEIIWSTSLQEHAHKEEAGKGGGGGGSYTSYTYTVSFAMALCKGPIAGVRKIWFDGTLVYSTSADASDAELQVSDKLAKKITVYTGSETQDPDPTMEIDRGTGNVPAYRGTAYIVFDTLEVTKYGNRIPQVTVEVVSNGSYSLSGPTITSAAVLRQSLSLRNGVASAFYYGYSYDGTQDSLGLFENRIYSLVDGSLISTSKAYALAGGDESFGFRYLFPVSVSPNLKFYLAEGGVGGLNRYWYLFQDFGGSLLFITRLDMDSPLDNYENGQDRSYNIIWDGDDRIVFYKANTGDVYVYTITVTPLDITVTYNLFNVDATREGLDSSLLGSNLSFCIDHATSDLYLECETVDGSPVKSIKRYSIDGDFIEEKFTGFTWRSVNCRLIAYSNGTLYEVRGVALEAYVWETETLIDSMTVAGSATNLIGSVMDASGSLVSILAEGNLNNYSIRLSSDGDFLSNVVTNICNSAGIDSIYLDTSDLEADVVRGFLIGTQSQARGALEQLSAAFFFDARETDGVLEFVKRGNAPTVTLEDDDLGCYEGGNVIDILESERTQEEELPKALTLSYANAEADYQVGAQYSLRQSVLEGTESTIQLPIALTDDEAKIIVDTMMFTAWHNRHRFTLNTWQSFTKLDPSDVISASGETMRIDKRNEGVDGIINLVCVRELPEIYAGQTGEGVASGHSNQSIEIGGPTAFDMLDIPPLRDDDYLRYGMYWTANGYLADWPGAALLRSADGGNTWEYNSSNDIAVVSGQAGAALGDFQGGNVFDEENVLRVSVIGTLESKTETQVLNGGNACLVGDELIQFRTATLISTGIYDLTGLLRGRIGTEWAMSGHADYERFVLLSTTSARFIDVPSTDLNAVKLWGCVTNGDSIDEVTTEQVTYAGNNLKPLSPVHIGGGTAGYATAWTINWTRRSRYQWQWLDVVDVGADEDVYDFEVAILDGATVVRVIEVSGAVTTTYSHAQQEADFGYWQPTITVKIRQIGAIINGEWSSPVTLDSGYISTSVLLMHGDGANGSTTLTDEYGHTTTAFGNCAISTVQSKFGGASIGFDGTGDYFTVADDSDFDLTGAFTFELQVYVTAFDTSGCFIAMQQSGGTVGGFELYITSAGVVNWNRNNTTNVMLSPAAAISTGAWHHLAVSWDGSTYRMFVNGNKISESASTTPPTNVSGVLRFGNYVANADYDLNGYIDEIRITLGQALYIANFIPPTQAFSE
jgi:hypothetical protein